MRNFEIRPLSYALGGEVLGLDVKRELSGDDVAAIHNAWADLGVLVIRGQELSPEEQIAFSSRLGRLDDHEALFKYRHPEYPEIFIVSNGKNAEGATYETSKTGAQWHSDMSYTTTPAMGSLLYAVEIPPVGGDTMFVNCCLAYQALSDTFRAVIDPLWAEHSIAASFVKTADVRNKENTAALVARNPPVEHPVVYEHPISRRKALYVSEMLTTRIVGMSAAESRAILDMLFAHCEQPEFAYRHQWRRNDLVMWDNRCVMHKALMDRPPGTIRHMHRTTILGGQRGRQAAAMET